MTPISERKGACFYIYKKQKKVKRQCTDKKIDTFQKARQFV